MGGFNIKRLAAHGFPSVMSFDLLYLSQQGGSLPSVTSLSLSELIPPFLQGAKGIGFNPCLHLFSPGDFMPFFARCKGESYHMSVLGFPSVISCVLFAMCLNYVCTWFSLCPFVPGPNMCLPTYHLFGLAVYFMCRASLTA